MRKRIVQVDLNDRRHCDALLRLLNDYMLDEMGIGEAMPTDLGPKIINGLKNHPAYIGFFVCIDDNFAALANCNLNFSTWKAKPLINIHDFIVCPNYRKLGVGLFLLNEIAVYATEKGYYRINLEVRNDNYKAQNLYRKAGFEECNPPNYFWEKKL
ncbi:GNAT family N-acetyltransferase [Maribellus comscasis]|uniref:GNAT family N-acetyltransferase n=1 Tax=Maribellus comscasis TaxID=2681766 RepID=A0A6I6JPZ7_9BACT|nr:GNAT family N-acetyltransferase [Maribellus comscasis]QGY45045.1 GNAT family N-acetyltransferase [Maribellus comscasis]